MNFRVKHIEESRFIKDVYLVKSQDDFLTTVYDLKMDKVLSVWNNADEIIQDLSEEDLNELKQKIKGFL